MEDDEDDDAPVEIFFSEKRMKILKPTMTLVRAH